MLFLIYFLFRKCFVLGERVSERICCPFRLLDSDLIADENICDTYFRGYFGKEGDSIQRLNFVSVLRSNKMLICNRILSYMS